MNKEKADNLIKRSRWAGIALTINSFAIIIVSLLVLQSIARRATAELGKLISIQSAWPSTIPKLFTDITTDITIGSDKFVGYMGYAAVHGSSPFAEKYPTKEVHLSTDRSRLHIYNTAQYQESVLNDLVMTFSSPPTTLTEFQKSWDNLAFPIWFIQFTGVRNWYLGKPDETNIVTWRQISKETYTPIINSSESPTEPIVLNLTNKSSQWNIMGNIWMGDDDSDRLKHDIDFDDASETGWFLYHRYKVKGQVIHLVGALSKPTMKKYTPVTYLPNSGVSKDEISPFIFRFPWVKNYAEGLERVSLEQLEEQFAFREQSEEGSISLFGFSTSHRNIILVAGPALIAILLFRIISLLDFTRIIKISNSSVEFTEPWLLLSSSKLVKWAYLGYIGLAPLIASILTTAVLFKIGSSLAYPSLFIALLVIALCGIELKLSQSVHEEVKHHHPQNIA